MTGRFVGADDPTIEATDRKQVQVEDESYSLGIFDTSQEL
jgi:hypothetical protein